MQKHHTCMYHPRLVLRRWFKEDLQDPRTFNRTVASESFVLAFPHDRRAPDFADRPEAAFMKELNSLFTAMTANPTPRRTEQQRKRRYANVTGIAKDVAEMASRDPVLHDQAVDALAKVAASAKRRYESTESETEVSDRSESTWSAQSSDVSDGDSDGDGVRNPPIRNTKGRPRTKRIKSSGEVSKRRVL
ncbi:hypothetical protein B0O80DRAFT_43347 [Mortierella sp. GBAus27b]|nr:hypothetical protein B0O80DRAFT_43347 [Mortierella sp. GBAus27b]